MAKKKTQRRKAVKRTTRPGRSANSRSKRTKEKADDFRLKADDIHKIARSLGVEARQFGNHYRMYLDNPVEKRKLTLEIYPDIPIGRRHGTLVTVYTPTAHLQLHFCSGYVISELLGEVTFVGVESGKMSGLIIEKGAACSLYANVDNELLSGDITQLGPEVMLSGIALSLTESILSKD